jgi:hypothetical protein
MNLKIEVAKKGYSILDRTKPKSNNLSKSTPNYIHYGLALPYLNGAYLQIDRYNCAILELKTNAPNKVLKCLHEASILFEDLSTIVKYVKMAGQDNELNRLIIDIRNHIRHDIRENFEQEDQERNVSRAKRLKIHPTLLTSISFEVDNIKVGETICKIQTIKDYLNWATKIIHESLHSAMSKGYIMSD